MNHINATVTSTQQHDKTGEQNQYNELKQMNQANKMKNINKKEMKDTKKPTNE